MAWNMHLSVVPGRTIADFAQLGMFGVANETIAVDQALSLPSPAVVESGGALLFLDGSMVALEFNVVLATRLQAEVVTGLFSGVSDTYAWTVLGPEGVRRNLVFAEGAEVQAEGAPLPEEAGLEMLDEDALFGLVLGRAGLDAGWLELPARALTSPPAPEPKKRGLFRRR
jgi:hypothetical protein